jgi:hypothetical protein
MLISYVVVTLLTAAFNAYAAYLDFTHAEWIVANMSRYGVPRSWLFSLGALKAVGAAGLLIGFAVPVIGNVASVGLVVYFIGAVANESRPPRQNFS